MCLKLRLRLKATITNNLTTYREKEMDSEQQEACMILQNKSRGLEEIFLTVGGDFKITDDDVYYAIDACGEILKALEIITQDS